MHCNGTGYLILRTSAKCFTDLRFAKSDNLYTLKTKKLHPRIVKLETFLFGFSFRVPLSSILLVRTYILLLFSQIVLHCHLKTWCHKRLRIKEKGRGSFSLLLKYSLYYRFVSNLLQAKSQNNLVWVSP